MDLINSSKKFFVCLPTIFFLVACGGGGGGGSSTVKQSQQPLVFSQAQPKLFIDQTPFSNVISGGSGTGTLAYSSSDSNVATVDSVSGEVTFISSGTVIITAAKAGDGSYNAASGSYSLTVSKYEQDPLTFSESSVSKFIDESLFLNNLSGGLGSGALSFSSSDTNIVTVDSVSGEVTIVSDGIATIMVTKAEDSTYYATSANYSVDISKYTQTPLIFAQSNLDGVINGPSVSNTLSGGSGAGVISYSSAENSVAVIDSTTGIVTAINPGNTTITVTKEEDNLYYEATASYTLSSIEVISGLDISVKVGEGVINWNQQEGVIDVFRSTDQNCDIDNFMSCANGNLFNVADTTQLPVIDTFVDLTTPAFAVFQNEQYRSVPVDMAVSTPPFLRRMGQQMLSFKGKLWVIAGMDNSAGGGGGESHWYNDIWSSVDGVNWILENGNAAFSARAFHQVLEYNGELYLIGGEEGNGTGGALIFKADVWKSSDGVLWQQMNPQAQFFGGGTGRAIVFNNKIWMIGGGVFTGRSSIWTTTNGSDWNEEISSAPFGPREGHAVYEIDNKLFLLGGMSTGGSSNLKNDIWLSPDGVNWTLETAAASFAPRVEMNVQSLNGTLWLTGGHSFPNTYNTIYSSTDGFTWSLTATNIISDMNQYHSLTNHDGALWIYSGLNGNYIWRSKNGADWGVPVIESLQWNFRP